MSRRALAPLLAALTLALVPVAARAASQPPTGWDGVNPYQCELQQAGLNETGPNPKADPYCVDFDKRNQNITELGLATFLLKEPGRVAAAADKCFYFQSDHWRGSIVQSDGSTKTYEFDGHYFTNQGTGNGGVWVTNFNVNGKSYDLSSIPGIPQEYAKYLGQGTGGFTFRNDFPANPACAERLRRESDKIYRAQAPSSVTGAQAPCLAATGSVGSRRIGATALGATEAAVRTALGAPRQVKRGFLRYCVRGGGSFLVGEDVDRSGEDGGGDAAHAIMLVTSSRAQRAAGSIGVGSTLTSVRARFAHAVRRLTVKSVTFYAPSAGSGVLFAVSGGRVRWVAVYDRARLRTLAAVRDRLVRSRGL